MFEETRVIQTYERPWGTYTNLEGGDHGPCKVKKIVVYPGAKLSLQKHKHRSEHWTIVKGSGIVQLGENRIPVERNSRIYIEKEEIHRMENTGSEILEFIEVQIGEYLGEDDIERIEDIYGRA
jgi:mannose-6-phosphate isomerase-like protein (cupin superfamily)